MIVTEKDLKDYSDLAPVRENRTLLIDSDVITAVQRFKTDHRKSGATLPDIYNIAMRKFLGLPLKK